MPAVNEPTEPKVEMQSLQLTCSLTPSSTEPSTWLVIIWLKRWPATPLTEPPLLPAPVGDGLGVGVGVGLGEGDGEGDGLGEKLHSLHSLWAFAGFVCAATSISDSIAPSAAERRTLRTP